MAYKFNPFTGTLDDAGTVSALNVLGTVANAAALPGGATIGDVYQAIDTGVFYVWDGSAWDSLGTLQGPAGVVAATAPITYNSGTQTVSTSMTTNRLLGRSAAGTGVAEEISIGTGLSLSGGTLTATGGGGGGGGDITSVTAGTGLSGGGTSGDVTLNLANTTVTPANYTNASITVDAQGRITSASSGTAPVTSVSATGPISSSGGTTPTISTSMATNRLLGRGSAGTGVAEEITLGTNLSLSGTTLNATGGGTPGGSNTQIQFNDGGVFGGDADLTWNKTTNVLTNRGDINLDDGGSFTTTVQCVTPTANRTISFPNATGTVALVAGSSGQLTWNNAGANAGVTGSVADSSGNVTLGGLTTLSGSPTANGTSSLIQSNVAVTGAWRTGASSNNPALLLNPTGTTPSTTWSTSGTGIGVNAPASYAGNLLDLQVNGTSRFRVSNTGGIDCAYNGVAFLKIDAEDYQHFNAAGLRDMMLGGNALGLALSSIHSVSWGTSATTPLTKDLIITRDAAGILAQRNGTNAQTFRVYNTFTSSTNYELGKLEWSSNVFRIGTEKGSGGGTARTVEVHTDSISRLALDTTGSVRVVTGLTVATLPGTPLVGMVARVTDATSPTVGSTVAGGGAAAALCWYNGTNWTVIGV